MGLLGDLKMYARFASGLRGFLRHTITLEEARAIVQQRLAEREANFLRLVEKGIFGYPRSPYLPLLRLAQVELGDIQDMVQRRGLEDTLRALREAGVYVTFEELKGREPMVRDGRVIPVHTADFDNPYLRRYYEAESGGTTGAGTRATVDLDHLAELTAHYMLVYEAHGILRVATAQWRGILPDSSGVSNALRHARYGHLLDKWFAFQAVRSPLKFRLATRFLNWITRLYGVPIPRPQSVSLHQAVVVARWAGRTLQQQGACLVRAPISLALRVSLAAQKEGIDLTGATFMGSSEPPTPAKVAGITRSGASYVPAYVSVETSTIGLGCAQPTGPNDLHFLKDMLALIQYPRQVPGSKTMVDAFHFTSVVLTAPKMLLNVETDDYGVVERRSCGCPLEGYGLTEHIRDVRSFRKLTGEGVTLVGSEMVRILEEVLPARFGGSPLDYQLQEEEDGLGFTRLSLLISPEVEVADEAAVVDTVLEALAHSDYPADLARATWSQARSLQVKRMDPVWTHRGKLLPLNLARHPGCSAAGGRRRS
jgi:hypothetical protein